MVSPQCVLDGLQHGRQLGAVSVRLDEINHPTQDRPFVGIRVAQRPLLDVDEPSRGSNPWFIFCSSGGARRDEAEAKQGTNSTRQANELAGLVACPRRRGDRISVITSGIASSLTWPMSDLSPLSGEERKLDFGTVRSVDDPHVWSGRALQVDFAELAVSGLASMYPVSDWSCSAPDHHGYQRACDLINGQASTGHSGHQCSHAPGRPNLHLVSSSRRPRQACSLSWRPWPAYRWRGGSTAGPSH